MDLRFFDDPAELRDVAGDYLAAHPVVSTVVAGIADRVAANREAGVPWPEGVPCWFAALVDGGEVVSAAMRTATFGEFPVFLLPMPDDAAVLLARTLLDRDEPVLGANGALPAVQVFCEEMATGTGKRAVVGQHTRLFELGTLVDPAPVPGRLRTARIEELGLVTRWYDAFMRDADEQAGRQPGASPHETPGPDDLVHRIETGRIRVWEAPGGEVVSLTAASAPSYGVSRVGPVYTPREHRGRGYASNAVAGVSRQLLDGGARACLFTDRANLTSNEIYEALGYERVVDMANLRVE
ncbi:MAG: GNAT family N-acetyltransferase [Nocardioides sp.]